MDQESALHTRAYFDEKAAEWDRTMAPKEWELPRIEQVIGELGIVPGDRVLDAGCGTGVLFPFLRRYIGPNGRIYALDISEEMLKRARAKCENGYVHFIRSDVCGFVEDHAKASFEKIVCFSSFPHFEDDGRLLPAFYRLLSEGGRLLIFHLQSSLRLNEIHARLPDRHIRSHTLPPVSSLATRAGTAGFSILTHEDGSTGYRLVAEKHS